MRKGGKKEGKRGSHDDLSSRAERSERRAKCVSSALPRRAEGHEAVTTVEANLTPEIELCITEALRQLADKVTEMQLGQAACARTSDGDDDAEAAKKEGLEQYLTGICHGLTENEARLTMYRVLKAEKYDITKAIHALMSTIEFRKRQNLNRMVLFPSLVPTRGYNERLVCETLHLPFLEDWQLTATGVLSAAFHSGNEAVGEDGRLRLNRAVELDNYYDVSYSEYMNDEMEPSSSGTGLVSSTLGLPAAGLRTHNLQQSNRGANIRTDAETADRSGITSPCLRTLVSDHAPAARSIPLPTSGGHADPTAGATRRSRDGGSSRQGSFTVSSTASDSSEDNSSGALSILTEEEHVPPQTNPSNSSNKGLLSRFLGHINPFGHTDPAPPNDSAVARDGPVQDATDASPTKAAEGTHRSLFNTFFARSGTSTSPPAGPPSPQQQLQSQHSGDKGREEEGRRAVDGGISESAHFVDQQTAVFVNADGAARTLVASPTTGYSEALDFHALLRPIVNAVLRYLPTCIHYWDRQGHPVMYIKLGSMRAKKLVEGLFKLTPVSTEPKALALLFHAYSLEVMSQLIRFNNRKNTRDNEIRSALLSEQVLVRTQSSPLGKERSILPPKGPANACVVVIDCAKVRFKKLLYKPLLQIVKPLISLDQKHYSELLHHLYVVNCNSAVNFSYLTIRSVLCEETRAKISFCTKSHTTNALKAVIDGDLLPAALGGRCQCPGGCIPEYTGPSDASTDVCSSTMTESRNFDGESLSETFDLSATLDSTMNRLHQKLNCNVEKLSVAPHKKATLTLAVTAREELFWEFRCKNKRSVEFSVVYIPVTADGGLFSLADPARVKDGASHYICPEAGTVILEWNNKYSKVHRINIHAKIFREGGSPVADS